VTPRGTAGCQRVTPRGTAGFRDDPGKAPGRNASIHIGVAIYEYNDIMVSHIS